jgi:tRNA-splicing ligase RtcB
MCLASLVEVTMDKVHDKLHVWGTEVDNRTREQASRAATLPFVPGHVALMPDAHVGIGATVGSVIPTEGAIVPSFAGVDLRHAGGAMPLTLMSHRGTGSHCRLLRALGQRAGETPGVILSPSAPEVS